MKISIIIPAYNNYLLSKRCIDSVRKHSQNIEYEIIFIDNGSSDLTSTHIVSKNEVIKITNATNLGFSRACNQGARIASGDLLIFLNNDTEALEGWINALITAYKTDSKIGIVGLKLIYKNNTIQHAGIVFDHSKVYHIYRHFHYTHPAVNKTREFQALTAACMLTSKDIFFAAGGFDETYRNGFEDLDFCLRVRNLGYKIIYTPNCKIIHHEGMSEGRHSYHVQNASIFSSRWANIIKHDMNDTLASDGLRLLSDGEYGFFGKWFEDKNVNHFLIQARNFVESGCIHKAKIAYTNALHFNPFDIRCLEIFEELGDFYIALSQPSEALSCYETASSVRTTKSLSSKITNARSFPILRNTR